MTRQTLKMTVLGLTLAVFMLVGTAALAAEKLVSIAATSSRSSYYTYHVAVAQLLKKKLPDLNVSVLETGGSVDNLRRINAKEAEWGQFAEPFLYEMVHGLAGWKERPQPQLRLMWIISPLIYQFVVSKDSKVKSLNDLDGKKMNPGSRGSLTEKSTIKAFEILGIKPDYYRASMGDAVAAMKDRRIVGYVKTGPMGVPEATVLNVSALLPVNILSWDKANIAKYKKVYPYAGFVDVPAGMYKNIGGFTTLAAFLVNACTKDLDADLVYQVTKAVNENIDFIAESYPAVKGQKLIQDTLKYGQAPLHPGVVKYCREIGLEVPARLIPPEMK